MKARYGVSYTVAGMHKWLHRNGFSYKKPKGRPHKADAELQNQFIAEYEKLKEEAGDDEPILFMDAVHPTQATKLSYGWIKTGDTKLAEKAEKLNIKLHFLPPYSPNLNPIERLWKLMNEKVRNNHFFKGAKDFKEAISGLFENILPSIGNDLDNRINDNFQMLKT